MEKRILHKKFSEIAHAKPDLQDLKEVNVRTLAKKLCPLHGIEPDFDRVVNVRVGTPSLWQGKACYFYGTYQGKESLFLFMYGVDIMSSDLDIQVIMNPEVELY